MYTHETRERRFKCGDVTARSLLFRVDGKLMRTPSKNPTALLYTSTTTSNYIAKSLFFFFLFGFLPSQYILSSRKIGSLLYIYTNRGKRFSKEMIVLVGIEGSTVHARRYRSVSNASMADWATIHKNRGPFLFPRFLL